MKQFFLLFATASLTMAACTSAPEADKATASDKQIAAATDGAVYSIDKTASTVTWIGTKPVGQHTGTFALDGGSLAVNNGAITAGNFIIDINSLNNTDLEGDYKTKLESHLKGGDFFQSDAYPTARFEISKVEPFDAAKNESLLQGATHLVSGNLTLKDQTKNVTFPAIINVNSDAVEAKANFNIDRTQWNMSYGNDKSLQDNFIRPEVNIQLDIKARN